jgi:triosephosphate isomerase
MDAVLFINFKNYRQAFEGFPKIYQDLENAAKSYPKTKTLFAPPSLLLDKVAGAVEAPIWAQHLDPLPLERGTGFLPIEGGKHLGIEGTFLNHSEHPLTEEELAKTMKMAEKSALTTLIFASTVEAVAKAKTLIPDYIAYEPAELIGGDASVTSAQPKIIPEAVEAANPVQLVVGAGIHSGEDIKAALEFGAVGAAVSSAIITAPNPPAVLDEIISGFG